MTEILHLQCPRLIEVALPIREISMESVRDKRTDQGNISSLHTWWARRPLAASRAVVFASLLPDPDHPACPAPFRDTVERLLSSAVPSLLQFYWRGRRAISDPDPYRPYANIDDTLRNRLLCYIAKWSPEYLAFETGMVTTEPLSKLRLDDRCLVKWETTDPGNQHGQEVLRVARELIRAAYPTGPPTVLDTFAGGGVIPLEAARLGCTAIANDYNPVAHLVQRATCEYPQIYGKPGARTPQAVSPSAPKQAELLITTPRDSEVPNVLVADFEYWADRILATAEKAIGHLYPTGQDGLPVYNYFWARTVRCANPSCRADIPLIRSLLLRPENPKVALLMSADRQSKTVSFDIVRGAAVRTVEGTKQQRGPAICPFCTQPTSEGDIRQAALDGLMSETLLGVVVERGGSKEYRAAEESDQHAFNAAKAYDVVAPSEFIVPEVNGPNASPQSGSHRSINLELYGLTRWGQLFNARQLVVMDTFVSSFHAAAVEMESEVIESSYRTALLVYLGLWISRFAARCNSVCRWFPGREAIRSPFSGQSIPMMWDYPEVNPFSNSPAGAKEELQRMIDVIRREQFTGEEFRRPEFLLGSATHLGVESRSCDCVVTDPPYGDAIAYADLSDFFYVWLKRTLGGILPDVFSTPQTPKEEEATSHKHRHDGSRERAHKHYRDILTRSFREAMRSVKDPSLVSVMFAHQSTEAWSALLSALFDAGLCPNATWPIATEMPNAALGLGTASLESSVTVVCRPRAAAGAASFRILRREIQTAVEQAVHRFWSYGFRGADLIVASYGPAVGVFGKYERVERADGTAVDVPELLDFARQAARDAIAGEFRGDSLSTLYFVWANLYGVGDQAWDDARLVVQIGSEGESAMEVARSRGIFILDGGRCRLALLADRAARRQLGEDLDPPLIDALHRAMLLWKYENRADLVRYLSARELLENGPFWKLAQALFEVLPRDVEDWKLVSALLSERETLRTEAKRISPVLQPQGQLFAELK